MTTFRILLLALASIALFMIGCVAPTPVDDDDTSNPDDDDSVADDDDAECDIEATGAIPGVSIIARKADEEAHLFGECTLDAEGECSMQAPASIPLIVETNTVDVVSCPQEETLNAGATPHPIDVLMGYGEIASHAYSVIGPEGQDWGTAMVTTTCQDGQVIVMTDIAGMYEIVGDQLLDINQTGTTGSVTPDLSVYQFSVGVRLERQP